MSPVHYDVIDSATDDAIKQLQSTGILMQSTRAVRALEPDQKDSEASVLSEEERKKIEALRSTAARQLKMGQVLADAGFEDEAHPPLQKAIHLTAKAFARERQLPEPTTPAECVQAPLHICWMEHADLIKEYINGDQPQKTKHVFKILKALL